MKSKLIPIKPLLGNLVKKHIGGSILRAIDIITVGLYLDMTSALFSTT